MSALLRDAPAGQIIRLIFGNGIFQYDDERPGFALPSGTSTPVEASSAPSEDGQLEKGPSATEATVPPSKEVGNTVDWYGPEDQDNPQNWRTAKKTFVFFQICLLTFAIYSGSSIIVPAEAEFQRIYGVTTQVASLVLSLYTLGYGTGPLFFSPLSEVPRLGRNIPYMTSFFLFIMMTIPTAVINNYPGIAVLRFIQGFLGGPVLATGGASAGDLFGFNKIPYALLFWASAAYGGPALGPLLAGFADTLATWRWSFYEMLILSGFTFLLLFFCLPETNPDTILLKRAQRLRKLNGNDCLRSQSEIKQTDMRLLQTSLRYLTTPFRVTVQDPSIAFINLYTALVYGIYYSFFESFPVVYLDIHGFPVGIMGVIFTAILLACIIGASTYAVLVHFIYEPYTLTQGIGVPEYRLLPGVYAAALLPAGLFIFGWTARADISWVVPTLGIVVFSSCVFMVGMVVFIYLPTSYPRYAASLFAANTFLRSAMACAAVHFSTPLFRKLGVGEGCSILGGCCVGCFFGALALYKYGPALRKRSKFAETY